MLSFVNPTLSAVNVFFGVSGAINGGNAYVIGLNFAVAVFCGLVGIAMELRNRH